jgi:hypothetical protein
MLQLRFYRLMEKTYLRIIHGRFHFKTNIKTCHNLGTIDGFGMDPRVSEIVNWTVFVTFGDRRVALTVASHPLFLKLDHCCLRRGKFHVIENWSLCVLR